MAEPNMDRAMELLEQVFGYLGGAAISNTVYLGDQLGLYRAMQDAGPMTPDELAEKTGCHPRWILEWLRAQGGAGLVDYHGDNRFELSPEQALILADEENSLMFSAGGFGCLPASASVLDQLTESFKTGVGLPFDAQGEGGNHAVARMFAPWFRHMLIPVILPGLDGVVPKLEAGAVVSDVGCGAGVALIEMAKTYTASDFHGYELSKHALALAERNKAEAGVTNVTFHDVRGEDMPTDGRFDFVTSFDCIHDMTHPREVIGAIRKSIRDDGTYLIADIKSKATYEENLEENPMAPMMYAMSIVGCMSSAMSEPDGEGLGTLGFHEELAREITREAGFTSFQTHDFGNPFNAYYELRP